MAGRKGQKRGPSKDSIALARYQSRELNEVLNVKSSQLLQKVMGEAGKGTKTEELVEFVKVEFISMLQFVTDMRPNGITLKQIGVNAPEDDDDEEGDDE